MAISKDIRVLMVKLADRLHNMRTLHYIKKPEKRARIAKETMDIYAPLAERIGIHKIKSELQDIAFKELYEDAYKSVINRLDYLRKIDDNIIEDTINAIDSALQAAGIEATIEGRQKRPFSIWLKMQRKNIGFESVTDIIAFRIITKDEIDCYKALGIIHTNFKMVPGYFDDYVSLPKANNYQSIHTLVLGKKQQRLEIQIRSEDMNRVAEYGVAAHWSYKQQHDYSIDGLQYKWVRQLLEILENTADPDEILENAKLEMYHDHVFCFTPNGELIVLPKDATPVDFAFLVHTAVGKTCAGAKVNGRVVPLRTKLKNGDQIEIIQAKNPTVLASWENFVITGKARSEIRKFIRIKKQGEFIGLGKSIAEQVFVQNDKDFDEKILFKTIEESEITVENIDDLYSQIGEGSISRSELFKALFPNSSSKKIKSEDLEDQHKMPLKGLTEGVSVNYSNCCNPLPGERIVGIQLSTGGVAVHTSDCEELEVYVDTPDKWIDLRWDDEEIDNRYVARLMLLAKNERGSLANITKAFADEDGNIYNIRIEGKGQDFCKIEVDVEVFGINHLRKLESALKQLNIINEVERVQSSISKV